MYTTGYGAPVDETEESLVVTADSEMDSDPDADAELVEEGDADEEAAIQM